MSAYQPDQERAVRAFRDVRDWRDSQLISTDQHDRMAADLETGLRRTNVFLRVTLFVFGGLIILAAIGLLAIAVEPDESAIGLLLAVAAGACFGVAVYFIARFHLYRFGIEEAFAVASIMLAGGAVGLLLEELDSSRDDIAAGLGMLTASVVAFIAFFRFGFVYAALIAMACAALAPFQLVESDVARRVIGVAVLAAVFLGARLQHSQHGEEFPGDNYAALEAAAWGGIYLLLNLKASAWLAHPVESGPFYWITYAVIWLLPAAGLWIAVRERHRLLLDVNIVLAIATLLSNKPYLAAERQPWDPVAFGILMIGIAFGLRRWLARGETAARHGFVAYRLLASERERLSIAGNLSVAQPSLHSQHAAPSEPAIGGGGSSGGAGASGKF